MGLNHNQLPIQYLELVLCQTGVLDLNFPLLQWREIESKELIEGKISLTHSLSPSLSLSFLLFSPNVSNDSDLPVAPKPRRNLEAKYCQKFTDKAQDNVAA